MIEKIIMAKQEVTDEQILDAFVANNMHPEIPYDGGENNNDCLTYYPVAKAAFNGLSFEQRTKFVNDAAYANQKSKTSCLGSR